LNSEAGGSNPDARARYNQPKRGKIGRSRRGLAGKSERELEGRTSRKRCKTGPSKRGEVARGGKQDRSGREGKVNATGVTKSGPSRKRSAGQPCTNATRFEIRPHNLGQHTVSLNWEIRGDNPGEFKNKKQRDRTTSYEVGFVKRAQLGRGTWASIFAKST